MRKFLLTLSAVTMALCGVSAQDKPYLEDLSYYLENTSVFEQGQEPGRAFHIPAQAVSLNGKWRFQYFESPYDVPKDFFLPSFNDRKWSWIEVPSNWEMQGFGQAVFRSDIHTETVAAVSFGGKSFPAVSFHRHAGKAVSLPSHRRLFK